MFADGALLAGIGTGAAAHAGQDLPFDEVIGLGLDVAVVTTRAVPVSRRNVTREESP